MVMQHARLDVVHFNVRVKLHSQTHYLLYDLPFIECHRTNYYIVSCPNCAL